MIIIVLLLLFSCHFCRQFLESLLVLLTVPSLSEDVTVFHAIRNILLSLLSNLNGQ